MRWKEDFFFFSKSFTLQYTAKRNQIFLKKKKKTWAPLIFQLLFDDVDDDVDYLQRRKKRWNDEKLSGKHQRETRTDRT